MTPGSASSFAGAITCTPGDTRRRGKRLDELDADALTLRRRIGRTLEPLHQSLRNDRAAEAPLHPARGFRRAQRGHADEHESEVLVSTPAVCISGPDLVDAIRRVAAGDTVFSPRLAGVVLDAFASGAPGQLVTGPGAGPADAPGAGSAPAASPAATPTRKSPASCTSRPRPWRATCRRCCASCSCPPGIS